MAIHQPINWQGQQLGRYRLVQQIGRGNTCEVWLADDTQSRHQVAIKLLPPIAASDTAFLHTFTNTARMIGALEHPNMLALRDFGEQRIDEERIVTYLVMPYIPAGTLHDRIRSANGPLPVEESMHYLKQAAQAIDYAHSQQVVHGDVKPANMLIHQGQLLLADFGIVRLLINLKYQHQTYTVGLGTAEYMAPELAQGEAKPASDRYSLATIAYHLFTGQPPFRGATPYEVLLKQLREMPPSPQQVATISIPQPVEEALMRGLAKRPEDRPSTCETFVNMLERRWEAQSSTPEESEKTMLAPWSKRLRDNAQVPQLPFSSTPTPTNAGIQPVEGSSVPPANPSPILGIRPIGLPSKQPADGTLTAPAAHATPTLQIPQEGTLTAPAAYATPTMMSSAPQQNESATQYQQMPQQNESATQYQQMPQQGAVTPLPQATAYPALATGGPTPLEAPYGTPTNYQAQQMQPGQPSTNYGESDQMMQEQIIPTVQAQYMQGQQMQGQYAQPPGGYAPYSPMAQPGQIAPQKPVERISRRNLLIGGTVGAIAIIGGGFTVFNQLNKKETPQAAKPTPTPAPGPLNLQEGVPLLNLTGHNDAVWNAVWSPDGRYLATAGEDRSVMVWDIGTYLQKSSGSVQAITDPIHSWKLKGAIFSDRLCWSGDGKKLIVTAIGDKLQMLDAFDEKVTSVKFEDKSQEEESSFLQPGYNHLAWAPKESMFASSINYKAHVAVWQMQAPDKPLKIFEYVDPDPELAERLNTGEVGWSKDGAMVASLTNNSNVVVWDFKTGKIVKYLKSPDRIKVDGPILIARSDFGWSPTNAQQIISTNMDVCLVWDIGKDEPIMMLGTDDPAPHTPPEQKEGDPKWFPHLNGLAWSPNGRYIAGTYARSGSIYVWDLQDETPKKAEDGVILQNMIFGKNGHGQTVVDVSWSPDGRYLASTSYDSTVIIWQVER